jgi:hypothetical protein
MICATPTPQHLQPDGVSRDHPRALPGCQNELLSIPDPVDRPTNVGVLTVMGSRKVMFSMYKSGKC